MEVFNIGGDLSGYTYYNSTFRVPLLIFIILSGGWILKISLSVFVLIGLYEFYRSYG